MTNIKAPAVPEVPVLVLSVEQLNAMLRTCAGRDFVSRRDNAMIRLFCDTGMRRGEMAGLTLDEIDFEQDVAYVLGKGRRPRACPFGTKTAQALDRYLRERQRHQAAAMPSLWLGKRGRLSDSGILQMVRRRGEEAGLGQIHPTTSDIPSPTPGWPVAATKGT